MVESAYTKIALARFVFGTDGSAQKSTTAYRPVKQLPHGWVRTVSWLNKGKIHVVADDYIFDSKMSFLVQPGTNPFGLTRIGSVDVVDARTIMIRIVEERPSAHEVMPVFSADPFGSQLHAVDCDFDLQILRKLGVPLIGEPGSSLP